MELFLVIFTHCVFLKYCSNWPWRTPKLISKSWMVRVTFDTYQSFPSPFAFLRQNYNGLFFSGKIIFFLLFHFWLENSIIRLFFPWKLFICKNSTGTSLARKFKFLKSKYHFWNFCDLTYLFILKMQYLILSSIMNLILVHTNQKSL